MDVLGKVKNLRGINFGVTETRFEAVWEKFGGKTAVIPHCSPDVSIVAEFKNGCEWVEHVLKAKTSNKGLCLMVYPAVGDSEKMTINPAKGLSSVSTMWELLKFGSDIRGLIKKYA